MSSKIINTLPELIENEIITTEIVEKNTSLFNHLKISLTITLCLFSLASFSQEHSIIIGKYFDKIEFGYSTRPDVLKKYKNEVITDTLTSDCPHTDDCSKYYGALNSLYIEKKGILFQTDYETGEIINKVLLYKPFTGKINDTTSIELGKVTVEDIYKSYPNARLTSTNVKKYWIIKTDKISFLIKRRSTDRNYPIKPIEINNRLIYCVILYKQIGYNSRYTDNGKIPLYAPKTETHINSFARKHKGGLHYILWSDQSNYKSVKNGYWKEFYPNHVLKEEGNYKKGKKKGVFKYYDKNGRLIKTKKHRPFLFW